MRWPPDDSLGLVNYLTREITIANPADIVMDA
jgi:hypothetical protein